MSSPSGYSTIWESFLASGVLPLLQSSPCSPLEFPPSIYSYLGTTRNRNWKPQKRRKAYLAGGHALFFMLILLLIISMAPLILYGLHISSYLLHYPCTALALSPADTGAIKVNLRLN